MVCEVVSGVRVDVTDVVVASLTSDDCSVALVVSLAVSDVDSCVVVGSLDVLSWWAIAVDTESGSAVLSAVVLGTSVSTAVEVWCASVDTKSLDVVVSCVVSFRVLKVESSNALVDVTNSVTLSVVDNS